MIKDQELYVKLQGIVDRFISLERLQEVAHGMDTQVNESFNNTFSWLAPKNKVYCGSQSLQNRLCIGIGINALGTQDYYGRLFKTLGIVMTPNVQHYLSVNENKRTRRIAKTKLTDTKKTGKERYFAKAKLEEAAAITRRSKRDGTYKTAQNLDDVMEEDDDDAAALLAKAAKEPTGKGRKNKSVATCKFCGLKGHSRTTSKKCLHYKRQPVTAADMAAAAAKLVADIEDAYDVDMLDSMPLVDDAPSDISLGDYEDCGTWSEDDTVTGFL
jgi:hypothetical protein